MIGPAAHHRADYRRSRVLSSLTIPARRWVAPQRAGRRGPPTSRVGRAGLRGTGARLAYSMSFRADMRNREPPRSTCPGAPTPERQRSTRVAPLMNPDRIVEAAIRTAKNILWENIPPTHHLVAGITVRRIRELVHSQSVQSALERSSDTALTLALRAVGQVVANQSRTDREIIDRLWDILDDPHLSQAMGIAQHFRMMLGPYPKRR
jgi:hypothetical protein